MFVWTVIFLMISLVAGVIGLSGIAGAAAGIAKLLFGGFLILSMLTLIFARRPAI